MHMYVPNLNIFTLHYPLLSSLFSTKILFLKIPSLTLMSLTFVF